jgi:hypothetical protein
MKINIIAASVLALGLLAPVAFAGNGPAGSEVNNRLSDYPVVDTATSSTKAFSAAVFKTAKRAPVGDFIDESPEESSNRSSNR